jgi:putative endonuclease
MTAPGRRHSERSEESPEGQPSLSHARILRCAQNDGFEKSSTSHMRQFYVYILASRTRVLYVGMTNDLDRRAWEHKEKLIPGFTAKYNVNLLVYHDVFPTAQQAIEAEKRIKGWTRAKKIALIQSHNPKWRDLSQDFEPAPSRCAERSEASSPGMPASPPKILRSAQNDTLGNGDVSAHPSRTQPPQTRHAERSEGSSTAVPVSPAEILRSAQNDG